MTHLKAYVHLLMFPMFRTTQDGEQMTQPYVDSNLGRDFRGGPMWLSWLARNDPGSSQMLMSIGEQIKYLQFNSMV